LSRPDAHRAENRSQYVESEWHDPAVEIYLETERLVLRGITESDLDDLVDLNGDPEVMRFLNGGKPMPPAEVRDRILPKMLAYNARTDGFGRWATVEKATGDFLGWHHFGPTGEMPPGEVELGYRLRKSAWGKGYGTEASRALVRKGFTELGVRRVVAFTMTVNTGSRKVMEKTGLSYVRTFFEDWPEPIEGSDQGDVEYALSEEDWWLSRPRAGSR
jgi:RimJ/RimL family protein N-acetyltransferase